MRLLSLGYMQDINPPSRRQKCIADPVKLSYHPIFLYRAPDDIEDADEIRSLLKDLRDARQSKISQGLDMINPYHLEVSGLR